MTQVQRYFAGLYRIMTVTTVNINRENVSLKKKTKVFCWMVLLILVPIVGYISGTLLIKLLGDVTDRYLIYVVITGSLFALSALVCSVSIIMVNHVLQAVSDTTISLKNTSSTALANIDEHHGAELEALNQTVTELLQTQKIEVSNSEPVADETLSQLLTHNQPVDIFKHELKTPLIQLTSNLQLAQEHHAQTVAGEQAHPDETISSLLMQAEQSAHQLFRLIDSTDELIDAYQQQRATLQPVDVKNLCRVIEKLYQPQIKHQQNKLVIDCQVDQHVISDFYKLQQILSNLISNANKHTRQGTIKLQVVLNRFDGAEQSPALIFSVMDDGEGIAADQLKLIFEPNTKYSEQPGQGIGLTLSQLYAQALQADLSVDSKPGQGSQFTLTVPVSLQPAAIIDKPATNTEVMRTPVVDVQRLAVVIFTDSRAWSQKLVTDLQSCGVRTQVVLDAHSAMGCLDEITNEENIQGRLLIVNGAMTRMDPARFVNLVRYEPHLTSFDILLINDPQLKPSTKVEVNLIIDSPWTSQDVFDIIQDHYGLTLEPQTTVPDTNRLNQTMVVNDRFGDKNILVVDNDIEQQASLKRLFAQMSLSIRQAGNGKEALESFAQQPADIIFMSIQMPGMDGYEVTDTIRNIEVEGQHSIIIAMTGHLQSHDVEHLKAVGMQGYITKPVTLTALEASLTEHVPEHVPVIDFDFDRKALINLQRDVGQTIFQNLVESFLEDLPRHVQVIEQSVSERESSATKLAAHTLAGSSRNFGFTSFSELCKKIESAAEARDLSVIDAQISSFKQQAHAIKKVLTELDKTDTSEAPTTVENAAILIVDDDRNMRDAMRKVLEKVGYRVREASTGGQVSHLDQRNVPDLILMDAMMPGVDGFTAIKNLRQLPHVEHTPILMVTALDDSQSIERAFAVGATDYIPKPLHFGVLRKRIARLLDASRAEQHVRHLAYHDTLTGLPNRATFLERLEKQVKMPRKPQQLMALLFLDLDRFKIVNDTLGHDVGDLLLKAASDRISNCVRASDTVARLGGDEFTVILDNINAAQDAARVAEKICTQLQQPFMLDHQEIFIATSIGISIFPTDTKDVSTLIKYADTAMFRAKEKGGRYQFYEYGMDTKILEKAALENELRSAIDQDQLTLHYQPQFDLKTDHIIGMEALVRWQHPKHGLVPPNEFISLAEESGLILGLGEWVINAACRQLKHWEQLGLKAVKLSINLSGLQLEDDQFLTRLNKILAQHAVDARSIELEITESILMQEPEAMIVLIEAIKQKGITLAIDDFGTGYSSLSYLSRFAVDTLKIDRSFINDITAKQDGAIIVDGIVALAKGLRLKVVAEGVETEQQKQYLQACQCDVLQGFLMSRPLPAEAMQAKLVEYDLIRSVSDEDTAITDSGTVASHLSQETDSMTSPPSDQSRLH